MITLLNCIFVSLQLNFHNNEKNKPITGANLLQRHSINSLLEQQDLIWSPNIDGEYRTHRRVHFVYAAVFCVCVFVFKLKIPFFSYSALTFHRTNRSRAYNTMYG